MNTVTGTRAPLAGHISSRRLVNRTGRLPLPPIFVPVENNHRNRDVAHRWAPQGPNPARDRLHNKPKAKGRPPSWATLGSGDRIRRSWRTPGHVTSGHEPDELRCRVGQTPEWALRRMPARRCVYIIQRIPESSYLTRQAEVLVIYWVGWVTHQARIVNTRFGGNDVNP